MALCRKVDHRVELIRLKQTLRQLPIPNVPFDKMISGIALCIDTVARFTSVSTSDPCSSK